MTDNTVIDLQSLVTPTDTLTVLLKQGTQKLLQEALEAEVEVEIELERRLHRDELRLV